MSEAAQAQVNAFPLASLPGPSEVTPDWLDALPPQANVLRPYQREILAQIAIAMRDHRCLLVQAPTGAGKTHIIATLVAAAILAGLRVLVLATRTRLVRQLHDRLDSFNIAHGVLAAAIPGLASWNKPVQIASVDTLYRRCLADKRMPLPGADVVVFDEAHLAMGASRQALLDSYADAFVFGFTATPAKTSGAALSDRFESLILGPSIIDLIEAKQLVKPRIFSKPVMSASELNTLRKDSKTGDYATKDSSALMSRPKLVGDVVTNWLRIANGKRTLVFSCDKGHGAQIVEQFRQAGVPTEQLTDDDDEDTREEAIGRLETGATQVLVNCFLLSYGIDIPAVECVVLARPTRSVVLYLQAIGRGMRPSPGKDHMILIDHGRVVENLGMPTYDREWSLDGKNVNALARENLAEERIQADEKPRHCAECECIWVISEDGSRCPGCGWSPAPKQQPVQVAAADLAEVPAVPLDQEGLEQFFREACHWYSQRWPDRWKAKENSGRFWAWSKTRQKFKRPEDERMPKVFWQAPTRQSSPETSGWLKSELIRYAKSKQSQPSMGAL